MLCSMTGFGRGEAERDGYLVSVEIKTINHKYLDVRVHGLDNHQELMVKSEALLKQAFHRGRVETWVAIDRGGAAQLSYDLDRVRQYHQAVVALSQELDVELPFERFIDPKEIFHWEEDEAALWETLHAALTNGVKAVTRAREEEGKHLKADLKERLTALNHQLVRIMERAPQLIAEYRERLRERVSDLVANVGQGQELDARRLEEEVVFYAERSDISEEIVRLQSHLDRSLAQIDAGGPVGRELDFLAQEMHREISTIGAKARAPEVSASIIAMKSEIKRLREQVRNLE
ncbi:MAG: YicC/YloC family endoribonuclease [Candidatus Bipolaricaulia bacterium]